jgi:hypothetical protein
VKLGADFIFFLGFRVHCSEIYVVYDNLYANERLELFCNNDYKLSDMLCADLKVYL